MPGPGESPSQRAARRATWPVHKHRLGHDPSDDLRATTTAEERLEMVRRLTLEAWALTGLPLPDYDRSATPVRRFPRTVS